MQVVFLALAVEDLADIREFISRENPTAAKPVASQIKKAINGLAQMPNMGKPGRVFSTRELIISKIGRTSYLAVYRVKDKTVEILRVIPGMRDIDSILSDSFHEEE